MDRYSVFVPKLLPETELFSPENRSCPGCGQAAAIRIIGKAVEDHRRYPYGISNVEMHTSAFPYKQWELTQAKKPGGTSLKLDAKKIFAMAGESGSFDDGIRMLTEAKKQGKSFIYICLFNEAGIERHREVPLNGYHPDGTKSFIRRLHDMKNLIDRAKAISPDFMATACPSHPFDLVDKVKKTLDCRGISFLAVFVPCPTGCSYDPAQSLNSGRLAVETGFFPLYQIEHGSFRITVSAQSVPRVSEYMKLQPSFVMLSPDEVKKVQDAVDKNTTQ